MRLPRMRYSCCWMMLLQWHTGMVGEGPLGDGGGPGPLVLLPRLLTAMLVALLLATTDAELRTRLRTETFDKPPPSIGTQPPDESSRVITCARTRTNESFLIKQTNKTAFISIFLKTTRVQTHVSFIHSFSFFHSFIHSLSHARGKVVVVVWRVVKFINGGEKVGE